MRFLLPIGGVVDHRYGILTSPAHTGTPAGIVVGMDWAADNDSFKRGFAPDVFFPWLDGLMPYRDTCLFVTVPDALGDADKTLNLYREWYQHFTGWSLAFVAQDGLERLPAVDFDVLFIGGTTEYKLSNTVAHLIQDARKSGKRIHIGRVNWHKRYNHFALMEGSEEFTCDGTRTRFDGAQRTIRAWTGYMAQRPLHRVIPDGDSRG